VATYCIDNLIVIIELLSLVIDIVAACKLVRISVCCVQVSLIKLCRTVVILQKLYFVVSTVICSIHPDSKYELS